MSKKIFIADDDPAILEVLSLILEDAGYEVNTSSDGRAFLSDDANTPDLFMLDIWMSGKDGRDVCRHLKLNQSTKHIPIVIVSANKDIEKIALEIGADAFLSKPFEMNDLIKLISQYIN